MGLRVRPVRDPRSRLGRAFIALPQGLYRDNPYWVPPLASALKKVIAREHPFFEHSDGQAFVILDGDRAVGRYLLLLPRRFNEYTGRADVRIGMPEAINDDQVWDALLLHAREWASQRGADRLIGPQHFSPMDGAGVLVEGYDQRASMTMMSYQHPFVAAQFERLGFRKYKDFVSGLLTAEGFQVPDKIRRVAAIAGKRAELRIEHPDTRSDLRALGREVGELYNQAWGDHAEFRPLTERELRAIVDNLVQVSVPRVITVLRASGGELAGFVLPFPDLSPALQRAGGYLGLRGLFDLAREKRRARHWIINGLGVLPEYRNRGATALLYTALIDRLLAVGVDSAEMTQVAETTDLMLSDMQTFQATVYKRHRVYELPLD